MRATNWQNMASDSSTESSDCSLRFRFRSQFGMKYPGPAGIAAARAARGGPLDPAGSISSHAPVPGRCSSGWRRRFEKIGRSRLPECPALSLRAEGVGFFPNTRLPRVIWVGINDRAGRLVDLQQRIETAVGQFSPEPGEKNYTGHVTLGRLKNPRPADTRDWPPGAII